MRRVGCVLVVLFVACDPSDPIPYTPTYDPRHVDPVPQVEFCAQLAQNVCAVLRPCCSSSPFAFDEGKCRIVSRSQCEARRAKSLESGLSYDDVLAGTCVEGTAILVANCALADSAIDAEVARVVDACRLVWHGDAGTGVTCDPKNPLACAPAADGVPALCLGTCTPVKRLAGGDSCGVVTDAGACFPPTCVCGPGLRCQGDPARCTGIYHPLGAPCSNDVECSGCSDGSCPRRCGCEDPSDACTVVGGAVEVRRCRKFPGLGEKCYPGDRCDSGLRCDKDKDSICVVAKPLGAPCGAALECASGRCQAICIPGGVVDASTCDGAPLGGRGAGGLVDLSPLVSVGTD
jgi:hypothetical protein